MEYFVMNLTETNPTLDIKVDSIVISNEQIARILRFHQKLGNDYVTREKILEDPTLYLNGLKKRPESPVPDYDAELDL